MKKIILSFLVSLTIVTNGLAAGSSNGGDTKSKYNQAVKFIEAAKKK